MRVGYATENSAEIMKQQKYLYNYVNMLKVKDNQIW